MKKNAHFVTHKDASTDKRTGQRHLDVWQVGEEAFSPQIKVRYINASCQFSGGNFIKNKL